MHIADQIISYTTPVGSSFLNGNGSSCMGKEMEKHPGVRVPQVNDAVSFLKQ